MKAVSEAYNNFVAKRKKKPYELKQNMAITLGFNN